MKNDYTDITVLLDRSGSMEIIKQDTIGGFNTFLKTQKGVPGEATLTLIQFDGSDPYEVVENNVSISEAKNLTDSTFVPRGSTPLYDSVGVSIVKTGEKLAAMREEDRPGKVVFVIITDGQENASKEYSKDRVKNMIELQTKEYSWEFVFLAANQDAMISGGSIGIKASNSMTYNHTDRGITSAFNTLSSNLVNYRTGLNADMSVSLKQREDAITS